MNITKPISKSELNSRLSASALPDDTKDYVHMWLQHIEGDEVSQVKLLELERILLVESQRLIQIYDDLFSELDLLEQQENAIDQSEQKQTIQTMMDSLRSANELFDDFVTSVQPSSAPQA